MYIIKDEPRIIDRDSDLTKFPQHPKLMVHVPGVTCCHKHGCLWKFGFCQKSPVVIGIVCDGVIFGKKMHRLHGSKHIKMVDWACGWNIVDLQTEKSFGLYSVWGSSVCINFSKGRGLYDSF